MYDHPMVPDAHTFRLATEKDLRSLAIMHVQAWREAYRDLMPNAVLAALDPTKREATWRQVLHQGTRVTLALLEASVVGFMGCGERRHPTLPADGEIYGLYVLERAQRQGVGRELFLKRLGLLARKRFNSAALWVFEKNARARSFYDAMGGEVCANRIEARDGWQLGEVAYAWRNLPSMLGPALLSKLL